MLEKLKSNLKNLLKDKNIIALIVLLAIGAIIAFWNYPYRFYLDDETVRDAIMGIQGARSLQLPLIGPFSSAGPFTFGPWYYYQLIAFSIVYPFPHAPWIYLSIAYILSIFVAFKIGEIIKGREFGVILAALSTFSPGMIIGGSHLTNPNLLSFWAFLTVYLFLRLIQKKTSYWWAFAFGLALGITINIHYQAIYLSVLLPALLIVKGKRILYFVISLIGIFMTFIPLLFFDLINNWFNFKNATYFYLHGKDMIYVPNRWLFYVRDFWPQLWSDVAGGIPILAIIFMGVFGLIVLFQLYKRNFPKAMLILTICFGIIFIALRYYWGERFFGYFNFTRPFIIIFTGYVIFTIYKLKFGKIIAPLIILFIVFLSLPSLTSHLKKDAFNLEMYRTKNILEQKYPNSKFTLYTCKTEFTGPFVKSPKSLLYLYEQEDKIDNKKGIKLAYAGACLNEEADVSRIENTQVINLSNLSDKELKDSGWKHASFGSYYDETSKWWIKELYK
jgi:hypothetical protein